jgi:hypothetical protein
MLITYNETKLTIKGGYVMYPMYPYYRYEIKINPRPITFPPQHQGKISGT